MLFDCSTRPLGIVLLNEPTTAAGLQIPIRAELLLENGVDADAARATLESVDEQRQALEGLFSRVANPED